MELKLIKPELFRNLIEIDFQGIYYNLHNDFKCIKVNFNRGNNILSLKFKREIDNLYLNVILFETKIDVFDLVNLEVLNYFTLDLLYRGRFEKSGKLLEFDESGFSFYYLEFTNETKINFFCDYLIVTIGS